jgi:hypothetical protein
MMFVSFREDQFYTVEAADSPAAGEGMVANFPYIR